MSSNYKANSFNIGDLLMSYIGYKGIVYPGGLISDAPKNYKSGSDYSYEGEEASFNTSSALGSTLRKKDASGRWYFMPIYLNGVELPNTIISIKGSKTIVETAMVGRKGTVKELISVDDYDISVVGVILVDDFPDEGIAELRDLFNMTESISLKSALTDIFLEEDDKVVIKGVEFPAMKGYETAQIFKMSLISDQSFELTIE